LLYSLQVVDENCQLTDAGFKLAEFPLEPTIGRMVSFFFCFQKD